MRKPNSTALAFSLGVLLATTALGAGLAPLAAQAAAPAAVKANPPVVFAQDHSDLTPDPAARFGRLPNGMTYVIYKNATPPGAANVWLRIAAGSMMERESQRGLAHFIEHMAFNGSQHVPEDEMTKLLERDGLAFGADTNAFTSYDQTVYMLNIPAVREPVIDDVLFLMRETADKLLLDPGAIDRERGVILGEERARASAQSRAFDAWSKAAFPGQKFSERSPIGLVDVIKTAPASRLAEFYHDFYRPEYATLIVVGDIDPDQIEAKIKAKFSDWVGQPQSDNALTDFGTYKPKGEGVFIREDKGLRTSMQLIWSKPWRDRPETKQKDYDETLLNLAESILAQRFGRAVTEPNSPLQGANFYKQNITHTAEVYTFAVTPKPHQDRAALTQALTMLRQFTTFGVTQSELDLALVKHEAQLAAGVKSERTLPTRSLSEAILAAIGEDEVLTSPSQNDALFKTFKPRLTLAAINAMIKNIDLGDGPLIARQGETVEDFDRPAIEATFKEVMARPVTPPAVHQVQPWPYTQFGAAGKVVSRQEIADLGVTRVTFTNGVTLTVKPTKFADDKVDISVRFPGGDLTVAPKDVLAMKTVNAIGLFGGGLGKLKADDIRDSLAGKIVGLNFGVGENAAEMSATTTKTDLATQMQLMMAFATDPGFRPEALDHFKASLPNYYVSLNASPSSVYGVKAVAFLHGGDPRFTTPDQAEFMAVRNEDVRAYVKNILDTAPIEITVVGDTSVDDAISQVSATFATLAPRPAAITPRPGADKVSFPTKDLHQVYTHTGRPDQNMSALVWPTADFYSNTADARGMELLASVMTLRLLDEVREKQGATYSAGAANRPSTVFKGYGTFIATATVPTEGDPKFVESVAKIVEDLKAKPISDDEMTRARKPIIEHDRNGVKTNGYWFGFLDGSVELPAQLDSLRQREPQLLAVTPADLQRLAKTYLDMSKVAHIQVKGEAKK